MWAVWAPDPFGWADLEEELRNAATSYNLAGMTPHELNSERLHAKIKPSTKKQLETVAYYDERFASEAEVVRHLLETFLPDMQRACSRKIAEEPTVVGEPIGEGFPAAKVPRPFAELPRLTRDQVIESDRDLPGPVSHFVVTEGGAVRANIQWGHHLDDAHRDARLEWSVADELRRSPDGRVTWLDQALAGNDPDGLDLAQAAEAKRVGRTPCTGIHAVTQSMGKVRCSYCGSVHEGNRWISEQEQIDAGTA